MKKRPGVRVDSSGHSLLIFLTGGVILALQLLASRVLTPYFGVSLYIWTGILSITLLCLALGYYLGGRMAQRKAVREDAARLESLFLRMPALSSVAMGAACLLYPKSFKWLSEFGLVAGSFLACAVLLGVPLVAMSAMNPLLVALKRTGAAQDAEGGDSGAGWVFFISTLGSVAGVLVAAFLLIPKLTNFRGIALLGSALSAATILAALASRLLPQAEKLRLVGVAAAGGVTCAALLLLAESYLDRRGAIRHEGATWTLVAEYPSSFGNIKVVDVRREDHPEEVFRMLLNDGLNQNTSRRDGTSLALFAHSMLKLGLAFRPEARTALALGLGAGVVPAALWRRGVSVDVAEINPTMLTLAERQFSFPAQAARVYFQDARTFVRRCGRRYDLLFVDLYLGDGIPEHLVTREFFTDLDRCLAENGALVLNSFLDHDRPESFERMLATMCAVFNHVIVFEEPRIAGTSFGNATLVATQADPQMKPEFDLSDVPPLLREKLKAALENGREITVPRGEPLTDEANTFLVLNSRSHMEIRRFWVRQLPRTLLVN